MLLKHIIASICTNEMLIYFYKNRKTNPKFYDLTIWHRILNSIYYSKMLTKPINKNNDKCVYNVVYYISHFVNRRNKMSCKRNIRYAIYNIYAIL